MIDSLSEDIQYLLFFSFHFHPRQHSNELKAFATMISYRISCFTPTKPSTSNPRRSQAVIVRPSNIQFHQLSTDCIQRNNDRPTPILVQRHRPTIEHFSANRQPVDLQSLIGSQLHFMRSTPSAVQPPSARCKPVHYSKPVKISQPLQMPVWAPILTRKQITPFQTSRSKSILPKYSITPQYHQFSSEKKSSDVFRQNAVKDLVDQCKISPFSLS